MHRNLTVHEVLYYQARLRLPSGTDTRTINYKIRQVILVTVQYYNDIRSLMREEVFQMLHVYCWKNASRIKIPCHKRS